MPSYLHIFLHVKYSSRSFSMANPSNRMKAHFEIFFQNGNDYLQFINKKYPSIHLV
jgi:hypothetical protein